LHLSFYGFEMTGPCIFDACRHLLTSQPSS
jgi:hypothetical protein